MESLLVEKVFSRLIGITTEKGLKFLSDHWIALKVLQ